MRESVGCWDVNPGCVVGTSHGVENVEVSGRSIPEFCNGMTAITLLVTVCGNCIPDVIPLVTVD